MVCSLWQNEATTHQSERRKQTLSETIVQLNKDIIKGQIRELVRGSVEEALIELYLAGVSVRRIEETAEALWGSKKYMNMKRLEAALLSASLI